MTYALIALSYLIGATPTSYWMGRAVHGLDLREHGSGNLGATNVFRILGAKWALPVVAVDIAKGFLPVWFFPGMVGGDLRWTLAFGGAAIVGHIFSLWVGFKGGKGIATSAGVFLALATWAVLAARRGSHTTLVYRHDRCIRSVGPSFDHPPANAGD